MCIIDYGGKNQLLTLISYQYNLEEEKDERVKLAICDKNRWQMLLSFVD